MKLLVIVTGQNSGPYIEKCLQSLIEQNYQTFDVVVIDDKSDDDTHQKAVEFMNNNQLQDKFTILKSLIKQGPAMCRITAETDAQQMGISYDVVVWVDAQDYLLPGAFERIAKEYQDPDCWLTYGNMIHLSNCFVPYFKIGQLEPKANPREEGFNYTHLRTHRKGLLNHITEKDVMPNHFMAYPDLNMLFCMLELCGTKHVRPIYSCLYVLRDNNQKNPYLKFPNTQRMEEMILSRKQPKKQPLESL